jgi:hypothetical protein
MAGNQIVLTFAGEDRDLRGAFKRVGESSRVMADDVKRSSKSFDDAGTNVGKFKTGVEAAGRMAVPAAATSAALLGAAVAPAWRRRWPVVSFWRSAAACWSPASSLRPKTARSRVRSVI